MTEVGDGIGDGNDGSHDAGSVEALGTRLLGTLAPLRQPGVIHVTAVHARGDALTTMRIGPATPKSAHDFFLLSFVRAHADAIVSTLKNLRDEPHLRFELLGEDSLPSGLADYRSTSLGKQWRPWLVLLSTTGDVDLHHPALHGWARPALVMPTAVAPAMAARLQAAGMTDAIALWPSDDSSLRATVERLRARDDVGVVSIEAGPSTAATLYRPPCLVDALVLARFEGEVIAPEVVGGPIPALDALRALLPQGGGPAHVAEPSGPWSFELLFRER